MLIKLDEVKKLLSIDLEDSSKNDQIKLLISSIQDFIIEECGINQFKDDRIQLSSSNISFASNTILDSDSQFLESDFIDGLDIVVEDSLYNFGIYSILTAAAGTLTCNFTQDIKSSFITEEAGESITITRIVFPLALKRIIFKMIQFDMNKKIAEGLTSESIADYSSSFGIGDYPESLKKDLALYRCLK